MKLLSHLFKIELKLASDTAGSPLKPLGDNLTYSHNLRASVYQYVKVAGERILKLCKSEQLCHHGIVVSASLAVYRNLKTVKVCLISDIRYFFCLSGFDEFRNIVNYRLNARRIRNLGYLNKIVPAVNLIFGSYAYGTSAGLIYLSHLFPVIKKQSATREIRGRHIVHKIVPAVNLIFGSYAYGTSAGLIYLSHLFPVIKKQSATREIRGRHIVHKIYASVFEICLCCCTDFREIE